MVRTLKEEAKLWLEVKELHFKKEENIIKMLSKNKKLQEAIN